MSKIVINGGNKLIGEVAISGMKNAAMPIIFACLLVDGDCNIDNLPDIEDTRICLEIIERMGAKIIRNGRHSVTINTSGLVPGSSPAELAKKVRGSYYLMGAELGRHGSMSVYYPGGCDFGQRPIDQHIKGFKALGVEISEDADKINGSSPSGMHPANIFFDKVSVGATVNVMLASVLVKGTTVIDNAAREPHIVDLANFLNTCGADIKGAGTNSIKINGVEKLEGCSYTIIPDMIEAGTYLVAGAATKGVLKVKGVIPRHLESTVAKLVEMGVTVNEDWDSVVVDAQDTVLKPVNIQTQPYPGFPTDMHPQFAVLLSITKGESRILEGIYDKRFRYTEELKRMEADITVDQKTAVFHGVDRLKGASIRAIDLRAGAAAIIAGLCAEGTTTVDDIFYIERGYDGIVEKLRTLGADIRLDD